MISDDDVAAAHENFTLKLAGRGHVHRLLRVLEQLSHACAALHLQGSDRPLSEGRMPHDTRGAGEALHDTGVTSLPC